MKNKIKHLFKNSGNPNPCFDDVLLVQQLSNIKTRKDINLSQSLWTGKQEFVTHLPVVSSPMDTVFSLSFASVMNKYGAPTFIPRKKFYKESVEVMDDLIKLNSPVCSSISLGFGNELTSKEFYRTVKESDVICIDVANGYNTYVAARIAEIKSINPDCLVMAGCVTDIHGFEFLAKAGADAVRMGVGSGSICSTRLKTGHGLPVFSSVLSAAQSDYAKVNGGTVMIIADGGHRYPGDVAKSIAAGADYVMLGSMLAGHTECPGQMINLRDKKYKIYRGMASFETTKEKRHVEGVQAIIPHKGPLEDTLRDIRDSLLSALSYTGAITLEEFRESAMFYYNTTNTMRENDTHIKFIGI